MTLEEALKRIDALERRVRELEARPVIQHHHHYHTYPPNYVGPVPYVPPQPPLPTPFPPWIVCGPGNNVGARAWAGNAVAGGGGCAAAPFPLLVTGAGASH